ncbi:MAG: sporulation protein YabP [Oscillospiraceae bacterium]|nr:sporulation protein YabP [Oscillospiraceae bacterium]
MQKNGQPEREHSLSLEKRKILTATGIADVEGFDETKILAMLDGTAFTIGGKNLKIVSFSAETGNLKVEGEIDSVTYSNALSRKAGIFARIFK